MLIVWKLDRLGRNTQHVLAVVDQLTSRGIGFRSLTEGLHTDGPMGTAMLTIMAAFAQLEHDTMIERTRVGLLAAAANGRKGGRPRKVDERRCRQGPSAQAEGHRGHRRRANVGSLPRHRVPLPQRGQHRLKPVEPQVLLNADQAALARRMKANGETAATICKTLGIGRTTLYRYPADSDHDWQTSADLGRLTPGHRAHARS